VRAGAFTFIGMGELGHIDSAAKRGLWPQGLMWSGQFIVEVR
jgi:hypothetical protein